jgi:protease I
MKTERLSKFRVAILAADLFEESELIEPRKVLDDAGAFTTVIAPHEGEIQAGDHGRPTGKIKVDLRLAEADPAKFDAVLLPGGKDSSDALRNEPLARDFVRFMNQRRKPIASICHGGWLLVAAGQVQGRHLTSYPAIQEDFTNAGAHWYDREVVRDGNMLSSRRPADIPAFNRAMIDLFVEETAHSRYVA